MDAFTPNAFAHKIWLILFSTKFWLKPFLWELITTVSISWSKCLNFWTSGVVNKVTRILLKQGADTHVIKDLSIDLWQLFLVLFLTKGVEDGKGQSSAIGMMDLQVMTLLLGQSWYSKASHQLCWGILLSAPSVLLYSLLPVKQYKRYIVCFQVSGRDILGKKKETKKEKKEILL